MIPVIGSDFVDWYMDQAWEEDSQGVCFKIYPVRLCLKIHYDKMNEPIPES